MKLVKESLNEGLHLSKEDYILINKKLEYKFKKSQDPIRLKIDKNEDLSDEELTKLLKKFEYTYRKSNPEIINRIKDHLGISDQSNVKFSNLKARDSKVRREKEKKKK